MASTLRRAQSEFPEDQWSNETSVDPKVRRVDLGLRRDQFSSKRPSLGRRASRAVVRFLITFCLGVAAAFAWQSYGDAAKEMIASSSPQLGWLAPQAAPIAQTDSDIVAPAAPATPTPDLQQLKAMSLDLAAVRQNVEQLAAQFAAGQQQMAGDIATLQAAQQDILHRISPPPPRPAAIPARKPVPPPPTSLSPQAPPVR
jgi:hypothetical protein